MDKAEMIYIASMAFEKGWSYETLKYSDHMYKTPELTDDAWEYVEEIKFDGTEAFRKNYSEFKIYY